MRRYYTRSPKRALPPFRLTVSAILVTMVFMKSPRKAVRHAPTKYKVGQEIVYPLQGVGHIQAIEEKPFRDKNCCTTSSTWKYPI